ncbi:alpha-N-acetylgalactosaminide alpha-2,6-sialyltransferase 5-like, partial [Scleropages formosus]
ALKMHCKNCALVTSSGHLIGSKRGKEIDRTECVIRMNDAPTRSFGQDVGQRTSLRVVAHSSMQRVLHRRHELLNASQDTVFIFWGPSSYMRRDGKGLVYNNLRLMNQVLPKLKVFIISRQKMLQFDELFKRETGKDRRMSNSWLSTGWFTMAIALELCERINVYGMVAPDFCREPYHPSVPYHYYEPSGSDECTMYISHERGRRGSHHRFITEKRVFANWARTFDIHFYQPNWSPGPPAANWTANATRSTTTWERLPTGNKQRVTLPTDRTLFLLPPLHLEPRGLGGAWAHPADQLLLNRHRDDIAGRLIQQGFLSQKSMETQLPWSRRRHLVSH